MNFYPAVLMIINEEDLIFFCLVFSPGYAHFAHLTKFKCNFCIPIIHLQIATRTFESLKCYPSY